MKQNKNRISPNYLLILLLIAVVIVLYIKTNATYMKGFYLIVIAIALGQVHVSMLKNKLKISIVEEDLGCINKQESTNLTLRITNTSFLQSPYIYIFLKPSYYAPSKQYTQLCITLAPHSQKEIKVPYEGVYAGKEELQIEKIVIQDFFQVAKRKLNTHLYTTVTVLPQITKLKNVHSLLNNMRVRMQSSEQELVVGQEGEISNELKPYAQGDSLKMVHWKLVARRDIYMVRQREEEIGVRKDCVIILDATCKEADEEKRAKLIDKTLVACLSCIHTLLEEQNVCLVYLNEHKWESMQLTQTSELEKAAICIANSMNTSSMNTNSMNTNSTHNTNNTPEIWPAAYLKSIGKDKACKLLITATLTKSLVEQIQDDKNLNVLEMSHSALSQEIYGYSWHISQQYEVVRHV